MAGGQVDQVYLGLANFLQQERLTGGSLADGFLKFWTALSELKTATGAIAILVAKFLAIEVGEMDFHSLTAVLDKLVLREQDARLSITDVAKLQPTGKPEDLMSALVSIYYISLYYDVDPNNSILAIASLHWNQTRNARGRTNKEGMDDPPGFSFVPEELAQFEAQLSNLVEHWTHIGPPDRIHDPIAKLHLKERNTPFALTGAVCLSLVDAYLSYRLISNGDYSNLILEKLLVDFKEAVRQPNQILPIMAGIKRCIALGVKVTKKNLKSCLELAKQFYLFPVPYSHYARELLVIVTRELKAPGDLRRANLFAFFPALKRFPRTGKEKTAYVLAEPSIDSRRLVEFLRIRTPQAISDKQLQFNCIADILRSKEGEDPSKLRLENLDPAIVPDLFEKSLLLVDRCLAISNLDQAATSFSQGVEEIRVLCQKHLLPQPSPELKAPTAVVMPPFQFGIHSLIKDNTQPQAIWSSGSRRFAQRTLALNALNQIVMEFSQVKMPAPIPVRIILLGSDAEIHTLVNAYADLDHLDFQFFPVPTSPINPSSISLYLARRDAWYQRYVYNLSRCLALVSPRLLPSLEATPDSQDWLGSGHSTTDLQSLNRYMASQIADCSVQRNFTQITDFSTRLPQSLPPSPDLTFRTQLESYLKEASVTHQFLLWNCEVTFANDSSPVTVVFHKSFHAGIVAYTKHFKAKFDLTDETPDEEVQQSKAFKFIPPTCRITHNHTDYQGVNRQADPPGFTQYQHISAYCFDKDPHERGIMGHPHQTWLEVLMIEPEPKKRTKAGQIIKTAHSSTFDISSSSPFEFLLDGVLYQSATSIKISPCTLNRSPISLPIQSFFPFIN